jgi:hypothetical protein
VAAGLALQSTVQLVEIRGAPVLEHLLAGFFFFLISL